MGNPFRSLAELLEHLLGANQSHISVLKKLDVISSKLDQIESFLGITPPLPLSDEDQSALDLVLKSTGDLESKVAAISTEPPKGETP